MDQILKAIEQDGQVDSVQIMQTYRVLGQPRSDGASYGDPYRSLQRGFRALRVVAVLRFATGKGVRIAVIDTGVDVEHPDLAGQIALSENVAPHEPDRDIADLHGTAVAGVLAARARLRKSRCRGGGLRLNR